jgi:integrase
MRKYGNGSIDDRGNGSFRLRYRIAGISYTKTIQAKGIREARAKLAEIVGKPDKHIAPDTTTLEDWIGQWLELLKRNPTGSKVRRRGLVNPRTAERYEQLLQHAKTALGKVLLQKLTASQIDALYLKLEEKLAPRTILQLHNCLRPCLASAAKKKLIGENPADLAEIPNPGPLPDITVLDADRLAKLVRGFRGHDLEMIVDLAAHTGARRNEIIALTWDDIDLDAATLTISKSVEYTAAFKRHIKEPKTAKGRRTIGIDSALVDRLRAYRNEMLLEANGMASDASVNTRLFTVSRPPATRSGHRLHATPRRACGQHHLQEACGQARLHNEVSLDQSVPPNRSIGCRAARPRRRPPRWTRPCDAAPELCPVDEEG